MSYKDIHDYDDIIDMPRPTSSKYPKMPIIDRAAQFAPFAALTGHREAIHETARQTQEKKILDENQKELINRNLQILQHHIQNQPQITITYFLKDKSKSGGQYISYTGKLKKIDEYANKLIFKDTTQINIHDIYSIVVK